ncbi:GNAT family N-acetyltransferase [Brevibacillus fluminis]|nr:GNAT family N-acetyltransferase [Brevibacillus fluminis]
MITKVDEWQIEPYLDLLAAAEHVRLDRRLPDHDEWLRNRVHLHFARGAQFFGYHAEEECEPTGIVVILHEEAPSGIPTLGARGEILDIAVSEQLRRKGVGSILLAHAEKVLRERCVYCMFAMTAADDYDVIAFYGKNGLVPVATLPDVYGQGYEGNIFLRKILR